MACGNSRLAIPCIAWMAVPELTPFSALPLIDAAGYML